MAHIAKYKHSQVGGNLLAHIERNRGDKSKYGNQSIDPERSHFNYDLSEGHRWTDDYHKGYEVGEDYRRKWAALPLGLAARPMRALVPEPDTMLRYVPVARFSNA